MKNLEKLIEKLDEYNRNVVDLKLWLDNKAVVEYYTYKKENPTDRTAMDKIVAQLKLEDELWLSKEQEYYQYKVEYDKLKSIYNIVLDLLKRDDYSREDVDKFIEDLI